MTISLRLLTAAFLLSTLVFGARAVRTVLAIRAEDRARAARTSVEVNIDHADGDNA